MGMYLMRICGRILRLGIFRLYHYTSNKGISRNERTNGNQDESSKNT